MRGGEGRQLESRGLQATFWCFGPSGRNAALSGSPVNAFKFILNKETGNCNQISEKLRKMDRKV